MPRRRFVLKLTGLAAAASLIGLGSVRTAAGNPTNARPELAPLIGPTGQAPRQPGSYQLSGTIRLVERVVEIHGISNAQQISWAAGSLSPNIATFISFEHFDAPWRPDIRVTGGQLETLDVRLLEVG
jgi:hypothetical protein